MASFSPYSSNSNTNANNGNAAAAGAAGSGIGSRGLMPGQRAQQNYSADNQNKHNPRATRQNTPLHNPALPQQRQGQQTQNNPNRPNQQMASQRTPPQQAASFGMPMQQPSGQRTNTQPLAGLGMGQQQIGQRTNTQPLAGLGMGQQQIGQRTNAQPLAGLGMGQQTAGQQSNAQMPGQLAPGQGQPQMVPQATPQYFDPSVKFEPLDAGMMNLLSAKSSAQDNSNTQPIPSMAVSPGAPGVQNAPLAPGNPGSQGTPMMPGISSGPSIPMMSGISSGPPAPMMPGASSVPPAPIMLGAALGQEVSKDTTIPLPTPPPNTNSPIEMGNTAIGNPNVFIEGPKASNEQRDKKQRLEDILQGGRNAAAYYKYLSERSSNSSDILFFNNLSKENDKRLNEYNNLYKKYNNDVEFTFRDPAPNYPLNYRHALSTAIREECKSIKEIADYSITADESSTKFFNNVLYKKLADISVMNTMLL